MGAAVKKIDDFNASDRIGLKLQENSIFFLNGEIEEDNIAECIKWIVFENLDRKTEKILTLYINSTGGDLYQAFALIDMMKTSNWPIRTIGIGSIMSAAFLIFSAGTKGERYIAPNTGIMCHQFSSGTEAKYHDIKAEMKENDLLNKKMLEILKEASELPVTKIKQKLLGPSDSYFTAIELMNMGIADHMLGS